MFRNFDFQFDTLPLAAFYVTLLISCAAGIAVYVLRSLGLYSIAKRRQLRHAWFAWFPAVRAYLLGCVSDQYRYVVKGQNKAKRRSLLVLSIICGLARVALSVSPFFMTFGSVSMASWGAGEMALVKTILEYALVIGIVLLVFLVLALIRGVIRFVALYDLYRSCDPENAVIYIILSILFDVTVPFFLFFNRNRDLGMPPRKPMGVQYQPPQEHMPQI